MFSKEAVAIIEKLQNCKNAEIMPEMIASPASEQQITLLREKAEVMPEMGSSPALEQQNLITVVIPPL